MYFNQYADYFNDDFYYRASPVLSHVRVFHASPDAPPVDVYVNGIMIVRGLAYQGFTQYLPIPTGDYQISVFPSGKMTMPVINTKVTVPGGKILTVAAINRLQNIELFPIDDTFTIEDRDKAYIRFGHLSPNTPNVDITTPDGTVIFSNVGYKTVTNYVAVDPRVYVLEARPTGTDKVALYVPNIRLQPGKAYSVYAVGLLGQTPPLQVVIPLDGSSYIRVE